MEQSPARSAMLLLLAGVGIALLAWWLLGSPDAEQCVEDIADAERTEEQEGGPMLSGGMRSEADAEAIRNRRAAHDKASQQGPPPIVAHVVDPEGRPVAGLTVSFKSLRVMLERHLVSAESREGDQASDPPGGKPFPDDQPRATSDAVGALRVHLAAEETFVESCDPNYVVLIGTTLELFTPGRAAATLTAWPLVTVRGRVEHADGRPVAGAHIRALRWDAQEEERYQRAQSGSCGASCGGGSCGCGGADEEPVAEDGAGEEETAPTDIEEPSAPPPPPPPAEADPASSEAHKPPPLSGPSAFPALRRLDPELDPDDDGFFHELLTQKYADESIFDDGPSAEATTDDAGRFQFQIRGRAGPLRIAVAADPVGERPHAGARVEYEEIPAGSLTIRVDTGRTLEVHVRGPDDKPVADARVLLRPSRDAPSTPHPGAAQRSWGWQHVARDPHIAAVTLADGSARLEHVPAGAQWVYVAATKTTGWSVPILQDPGNPRAVIRVPGMITYRGQVLGRRSETLRVVCSVLPPASAMTWPELHSQTPRLDAEGRFQFTAPAGLRVYVSAMDVKNYYSGVVMFIHDAGSDWEVAKGNCTIPPMRLDPPRRVRPTLRAFVWPGTDDASKVTLPRGSKLIVRGIESGTTQEFAIDSEFRVGEIVLMEHDHYEFLVRTPDGATEYDLSESNREPDMLLAPTSGKRKRDDGTWEDVEVPDNFWSDRSCG